MEGGLAGSPSARAWLFARYQPQPGLIFAVASSSEPIIYAIALLSGEIAPFSRGKFRGGFGAVGEELRGCSKPGCFDVVAPRADVVEGLLEVESLVDGGVALEVGRGQIEKSHRGSEAAFLQVDERARPLD